jgi:hypothetical protein
MDLLSIIEKHGGDVAMQKDLFRLESLPYLTRQNILSSVGDSVLVDVVDGTTITPEIVKKHFKRACNFYLTRRLNDETRSNQTRLEKVS